MWRPQRDAPRGGSATAGTADSEEAEPKALTVFLEPKTSSWAERTWGIPTERQPYLMIGDADDLEPMVKGDLIEWAGKVLKLEVRPTVYRPGDGYDSAEVMLTDQTTGGRG